MSLTAAVAAEIASDALICGVLSASGDLSLGNKTRTKPTQNAKRSRKNILLLRPPLLSRCLRSRSPTVVDKSQVFALRLSREGFAKNSLDLIRRKFLIAARCGGLSSAIHHFETIPKSLRKPAVHHLR